MKKNIWWMLLIIAAGVFLWREYGQETRNNFREETADYSLYKNAKGKFSMMAPSGWKISEATDEGKFVTRVVFLPGEQSIKVGNIGELSVTIVASPSANQPLSTQKEFDYWLEQPVSEATDGAVVKLAGNEIGGTQAVILADLEPVPQKSGMKFWSVTSWFRREGKNYYISMMGNGMNFKSEMGPYLWMVSKFSLLP